MLLIIISSGNGNGRKEKIFAHLNDHVHEGIESTEYARDSSIAVELELHLLVHELLELGRVRLAHGF